MSTKANYQKAYHLLRIKRDEDRREYRFYRSDALLTLDAFVVGAAFLSLYAASIRDQYQANRFLRMMNAKRMYRVALAA